MSTKRCSRCEVFKQLNEFNNLTASNDGKSLHCRECSHMVHKTWQTNNRDHVNNYQNNKYNNDPQHRMKKKILARLNHLLKRGIYSRRTEELLGCSKKQFLDWISFNFEEDLCWQTHGTVWEFDHITPFSTYDLTDELQLLAACNWKNLRPCIKISNQTKSKKVCPFAAANQSIRVLAFQRLHQLNINN